MKLQWYVALAVALLQTSVKLVLCDSFTNAVHRTQAAMERVNTLSCYDCDTMENGTGCEDVLAHNSSGYIKKCSGEEFTCMVKRFSYTIHSENSTVSAPKMWSLDRRCTSKCEPGCIVIGERTKLYACTSCCEKSLCNTGRGAAASIFKRVETGIGNSLAMGLLTVLLIRYAAHISAIRSS